MQYQELTEKIIGCAYRVHNVMGFGFLESVYESCLMIELQNLRLKAESQKSVAVFYRNEVVGYFGGRRGCCGA